VGVGLGQREEREAECGAVGCDGIGMKGGDRRRLWIPTLNAKNAFRKGAPEVDWRARLGDCRRLWIPTLNAKNAVQFHDILYTLFRDILYTSARAQASAEV
jgi:ribosomal protein L20